MLRLTLIIRLSLSLLFVLPASLYAAFSAITEEDGSPVCFGWQLKVANGNLTDNGDATCSIADQGGAGAGDNVTVNSTAVDTTADFIDNIYMDFDVADGGAGGPDDVTAKFEYAQTLAGDPALLVDEIIFFSDTSGPGFLSEGSTADTNEQLYRFPDANGADTTEYIVIADDANVSSTEAGFLDGVTAAIADTDDTLAVFAATTSAQLAGVLSDETGSGGGFARATSPTFVTPTLGVASSTSVVGSITLAGNPALAANKASPANSGIIFEGADDTIEGLLQMSPTSSDRTVTIPDATFTIPNPGAAVTLTGNWVNTSNPWAVNEGGTGAATFTANGALYGNTTSAIQVTAAHTTNGSLLIGDGSGVPTVATITGTANEITVTNGAGSITLDVPDDFIVAAAGSIAMPNAAAPTTNATAEIALDTTITDHQPLWQYFDGGENMTVIAIDTAELPALDNEIVKYDAATDKFVLEADAGSGSDTNAFALLTWSAASTLPTQPNAAEFDGIAPIEKQDGTNLEVLVASFDQTADECRGVTFKVPEDVDTSGTAQFHASWFADSAVTTCVMWYFAWDVANENETWDGTTTDEDAVSDCVNNGADLVTETAWTETLSTLGWTADETVLGWFCRDGDGDKGTDDLGEDAHVINFSVEIPRS